MQKPADFTDLENKIDSFKQKTKPEESQTSFGRSYSSSLMGFQLSVELLAGVLLGACIGYFLDLLFNTRPVILSILTILGGCAGVLNIYRSSKQEEKGR